MPPTAATRTRPTAVVDSPVHWRSPLAPAGLAAGLAAVAWAIGLQGTDTAAQAYRAAHAGLVLWDPGWYGGNYPLAYSVLSPLVMAALGLGLTGVVAATAAAAAFARLVPWPGAAWWFAASTLVAVGVGQLTYLCGEAVGLLALLAAVRARPRLAAALAVLTALFSPLAAAFVVLAALLLRQWPVLAAAVPVGALGLLFPGDGPFPFAWTGLAVVEALCLLVLVASRGRLRTAAAAYGAATLASFLVANPLGGNATRLAESVGVPLVLGAAWAGRRRLAAVAVLLPFAVWQWAPATATVTRWNDPAANHTSFYRPLRSLTGRIEVVPTRDHWEAAAVPTAGLVLARGWERQLDVARDPIFYRPGALTARSYVAWLRADGVGFVALPRAALDPAGRGEAALLRRGVPGLSRLWSTADWTVWRVDGSPGLGPVTALGPDRVVAVVRPGTTLLRVRWTPYWSLRRAPSGAVAARTSGGWTEVRSPRAGTVVLEAQFG